MNGVMIKALDEFGRAMAVAETHRAFLRKNCGLTDRQIGQMVLARRKPRTMSDFAAATLAAKLKLEKRRAQQIQN
jgi:hypothetical protein